MRFDYTQVFLLVWIIAFWVHYFLSYGKIEGKYERSLKDRHSIQAKWERFFGLTLVGWTVVVLIYFLYYNSINWIWKLSFLDHTPVKIIATAVMCFAFLLYVLFILAVGRSIQTAFTIGDKPKLITTGIYRYIRHPGYLAYFAEAFGIFFIIPNLITLALLIYTCIVIYGHTLEEEQKLIKIYGEEYERYRKEVGRFLPNLW